jgi:hypothetical protein
MLSKSTIPKKMFPWSDFEKIDIALSLYQLARRAVASSPEGQLVPISPESPE